MQIRYERFDNMKIRMNKKPRYICILLAIILLLNCIVIESIKVYADEEVMYEGNELRGWSVDCVWENGTSLLDIVSSRNEDMILKMSVTYYAPLSAMTQDYPAGTVKFSIPDFGMLKRSGTSFAIKTAADQDDTDWNCEYDIQKQMYIFSNARTFEAEKPLSGGFEMLWTASSRQSMTDFEMTENPIFSLENESTKMSPLTLKCKTIRDYYIIDLQRDYLSYEQYDDPSINKNGYVSYNYRTYFYLQQRARSAYLNNYFVKVSFEDDTVTDDQMAGILTQYWTGGKKVEAHLEKIQDPATGEDVWGFYRFADVESWHLGTCDFVLSYPNSLISKEAKVETNLLVLYYDENEYVSYHTSNVTGEVICDSDSVRINIYQFWYGDGNFSMIKRSSYERDSYTNGGATPYKYSDRLLSKKIFNNERVTFTLGAHYRMSTSAGASSKTMRRTMDEEDDPDPDGRDSSKIMKTTSSSSKTDPNANGYIGQHDADLKTAFDFVIGDDRLSVDLNNGNFRMLESDEYTFTRVIGPQDSRNYDYELYVSNVGYTSETGKIAAQNEYRLFGTGKTGTTSVFDLTNISSKTGFEAPFLIVGEPTDNKMVSAAKGTLSYDLKFTGEAFHSGYPQCGTSAVELFNQFYNALKAVEWGLDPELGETTWNIGLLHSDNPQNILSPELTCRLYFRTTFLSHQAVQDWMAGAPEALSSALLRNPVRANAPERASAPLLAVTARGGDVPARYVTLPGFESAPVAFGSDAPHLTGFGHKIICGPGSIKVAHRDNENVLAADLEKAVEQYVKMCRFLQDIDNK